MHIHLVTFALAGAGKFRTNELVRLYRDVRCAGIHPANDALTHEAIGKAALNIDRNRTALVAA